VARYDENAFVVRTDRKISRIQQERSSRTANNRRRKIKALAYIVALFVT